MTLFSNANPETASFYPDPYGGVAPDGCEVRWFDKDTNAILARACFRGGELTDGACPPSVFPAPALHPGMQMDFKVVQTPERFGKLVPLFELNARSVRINAIATLGTQLTARPFSILRCQDGESVAMTSEPLAFVELDRLEPGETVYSWSWFFTFEAAHGLTKLDRCELQFFTSDPKAKPAGTALGTFCIQKGGNVPTTTPGACEPPMPAAKKKPKK